MRFEPRVIPGDEPPTDEAGELLLPDDLQALADQLFDDASHLAARYPAESSEKWLPERRLAASVASSKSETQVGKGRRGVRVRRLAFVGTSLLSLTLLAGTVAIYWIRSAEPPREMVRQSAASPADRDLTDSASHATLRNSGGAESALETPNETTRFTPHESELSPVLLLENVSAPQLEGLYDLMEQSGEDAAEVSI